MLRQFAWFHFAAFAFAVFSATGLQKALADSSSASINAEPFSPAPNDLGSGTIWTPDHVHCAYVIPLGSRVGMLCDGKPSEKYDEIPEDFQKKPRGIFSADGQHFAFLARRGSTAMMVVDGVETQLHASAADIREMVFSPDGKRFAYSIAPNHSAAFVVLDGNAGSSYFGVHDLQFSPDGSHFVFEANSEGDAQSSAFSGNSGNSSAAAVVIDGKTGPSFDRVGKPGFSADGQHSWYVGTSHLGPSSHLATNQSESGDQHVLLDGKEMLAADTVSGVRISSDGKHLLCVFHNTLPVAPPDPSHINGPSYVWLDGQKWPFFPAVVNGSITDPNNQVVVLSPDGTKAAYLGHPTDAASSQSFTVGVNGQSGVEYESIDQLHVYGDDHVVYVARQTSRGQTFVIDNGNEIGPYGIAPNGMAAPTISLLISPDDKRLAYEAITEGIHCVVVDGKPQQSYQSLCCVPIFSPDSKRLAYIDAKNSSNGMSHAYRGQNAIKTNDSGFELVCDGNVQGIPGSLASNPSNLTFSPDGNHLAYRNNGTVVVDNRSLPLPKYARLSKFTFTSDSSHLAANCSGARMGARLRGELILVDGQPIDGYGDASRLVSMPDGTIKTFAFDQDGNFFRLTITPGSAKNFGTEEVTEEKGDTIE